MGEYRVFIFEATLTIVGAGGKLGIYIPKNLESELMKYKGKKVIVHVYVPL